MPRSPVIHTLTRKAGNGPDHGASAEKVNPVMFAEKFCAERNLAPKKYEDIVLTDSLYPAARLLRPVLRLKANYFAADHEFIRRVGRLARLGDFEAEAEDFIYDPNNRGFLRRMLKLRVSARRLRRMVRKVMREGGQKTEKC